MTLRDETAFVLAERKTNLDLDAPCPYDRRNA
jgi:hypothetical protein